MPTKIKAYNNLVSQVNELTSKYTIDEIKNDKDKKLQYIEKLIDYKLKPNKNVISGRNDIAKFKEVYDIKEDEMGVIKVNTSLNPVSFFITNKDNLVKDLVKHKAISSIIVCGKKAYREINFNNISLFNLKQFECFDKVCINELPTVKNKKSIGVTSEEKKALSTETLGGLKKLYFDSCIGKDYEKNREDIMFNLTSYTKFLENEHFIMLGVDNQNKVSDIRELNIGAEACSPVSVSNVIKFIEEHKDCHRFASLHNHPTGNLKASVADINIWAGLNHLAKNLGVSMDNDFILGKDNYYDKKLDQVIPLERNSELKKNLLLEDVKKALMGYCQREFGDNYTYDNFSKEFPDEKHIGLAYTTTPDENHEIQYELNLEDLIGTQSIDGEVITTIDYLKEFGSEEKALEVLKEELLYADFDGYVEIDEGDLRETLGLEIDDDGNLFDPLSKDLDNDGIADRYDNDFKDSDYLESTYDVEDKEITNKKESTLELISKYKEQISTSISTLEIKQEKENER